MLSREWNHFTPSDDFSSWRKFCLGRETYPRLSPAAGLFMVRLAEHIDSTSVERDILCFSTVFLLSQWRHHTQSSRARAITTLDGASRQMAVTQDQKDQPNTKVLKTGCSPEDCMKTPRQAPISPAANKMSSLSEVPPILFSSSFPFFLYVIKYTIPDIECH